MAVTALDPRTALIVIDLQTATAWFATAHPVWEVVRNAVQLTRSFRRHELPVVLVNVTGMARGRTDQGHGIGELPSHWTELLPDLDRQPRDHIITKQGWGAFTGTDLEDHLKARAVTQVVIAGVTTSIDVESTARHAYDLGLNVTLAVDAMTDTSVVAHANSITRIFPSLGEIGTTAEIVELLDKTCSGTTP
jgi:nicotinamidase-related amidase